MTDLWMLNMIFCWQGNLLSCVCQQQTAPGTVLKYWQSFKSSVVFWLCKSVLL